MIQKLRIQTVYDTDSEIQNWDTELGYSIGIQKRDIEAGYRIGIHVAGYRNEIQ